jgi:hypothetical protein
MSYNIGFGFGFGFGLFFFRLSIFYLVYVFKVVLYWEIYDGALTMNHIEDWTPLRSSL